MEYIPIAALVAIFLFLIKELLEAKRKIQASACFNQAIRILLQTELCTNLAYLQDLQAINQHALQASADDRESNITVSLSQSGQLFFLITPAFSELGGGKVKVLQPEFTTAVFDRNIYQIALHDHNLATQLASIYAKINGLQRSAQYVAEHVSKADYHQAEAYAIWTMEQVELTMNEIDATGIVDQDRQICTGQ